MGEHTHLRKPNENPAATHTLVVGGTGMLRQATLHFAALGHEVSAVARTPARLERLQHDASGMPGRIHPIALDYRDQEALGDALHEAIAQRGPIGLAVCWIHSVGQAAFPTIIERLVTSTDPWRLFHVRGSAAADPSWTTPSPVRELIREPGLYREVILGFVLEGTGSRWLTNAEISEGIIRAVEEDLERSIIGTVQPWERRP